MRLVIFLLIGITGYLGLHMAVLRKPLTIGYIHTAYERKQAYAETIPGRKLVVVGGSSSLYSVRCQAIAAELGMPCVNMAVTAGIGIDLILAKAEPVIGPGDVVLIPLEYDFYRYGIEMLEGNSVANQYVATYDRALLATFGWHRRVAALFSLSFQDIFGSTLEMALAARGIQRRFSVDHLTPQGDMSGHVDASEYAAYLAQLKGAPAEAPLPESEGLRLLKDFIARQHTRGARVIGTFPTTIDDGPAPPAHYDAVRTWWRNHGDGFVDLGNNGRYPRAAFFDTHYHLAEPAQIEHSRALAGVLRDLVKSGPGGSGT